MKRILIIAAAVAAMFAGSVKAQDNLDPKMFTIDENSVMITEITGRDKADGEPAKPEPAKPEPSKPDPAKPDQKPLTPQDVDAITNTLDKIVNLAEKVVTILSKGAPVVNISTNYANAVPSGITHWTQLQGWSRPATKKYEMSMKNVYGLEVVRVKYMVRYTHGGNFQGKGKYLTGVTVEPLDVQTYWGYTVDLTAEIPDSTVTNVGTHEDPVAGMQVQLKWKVHTMFKELNQKAVYYVQGDGLIEEMGTPFRRGIEKKTADQIARAQKAIGNVRFH